MESEEDKVEETLDHLYEYVEHTSGDKQLVVKLAIKLIENEYVHENTSILYEPLLVDLIEESRLHQKTLKAIANQTFFKSSTSSSSSLIPSIPSTIPSKFFSKPSIMDYFASTEETEEFDDKKGKEEKKEIIKEIVEVDSMPTKKDSSLTISHVGGSVTNNFSIFCDGACKNNGKKYAKAGYGISVQYNYKECYIVSKPLEASEPQTNQRAELHALSDALEIAYKKVSYLAAKLEVSFKEVHIYTDSEYSMNCLTKWAISWSKKGWKKANGDDVLHLDIIKPMFENWTKWNSITKGLTYDIQIHHVRSHTGRKDPISLGNERADELAVLSIS
jgi:ribonuclease HI